MRVGLSSLAILTQLTTIQVPVFAQSWSESRANSTNDSFPSPVSYIMASEPHVSNPAPTSGPLFPARPFPQHSSYMAGTILPDHVDQEVLDDSVRSFYLAWKKHYLLPGCTDGEKYVWFEGTKGTNICVSEGQGYGMMIVALMAGFDSNAQETYDCLYRFYKSHPSTSSADLMAWTQTKNCRSMDGGTATDGDMDIAYSLLLADAQWGRHSNIPYRQQALQMIAAIRREEINPLTYIVMEADDESPRSKDYFDMRSSDFMPDHIRAFREATGDPFWDTVLDNNYREFRYLQETYSPDAGLVPDFIKDIKVTPVVCGIPAQPNYLESKFDGVYNFNACRVPWRIAADYLVSGDKRAADFLSRLNPWIRSTTQDKPDNISAGYNLSGEDLSHRNYEALCFICPFAVAAMAGGDNQQWLDSLWDYIINFKLKDFDYYDNSIKMIDLIILSGNYWSPAHPDSVATSSR
jgi:endo-1,4-beta-D-glucanase Y